MAVPAANIAKPNWPGRGSTRGCHHADEDSRRVAPPIVAVSLDSNAVSSRRTRSPPTTASGPSTRRSAATDSVPSVRPLNATDPPARSTRDIT
jgi:hypothetical protein